MDNIRWHALRLCEVRRQGEDTITLDLGHILYVRGDEQPSQGGVGFLANIARSNKENSSVSTNVALYLYFGYQKDYTGLRGSTYETISIALNNTTLVHFDVVMGTLMLKWDIRISSELELSHMVMEIGVTGGRCLSTSLRRRGSFS